MTASEGSSTPRFCSSMTSSFEIETAIEIDAIAAGLAAQGPIAPRTRGSAPPPGLSAPRRRSTFHRRGQHCVLRVDDEYRQQLGRFGFARIRTQAMAIARPFGETFSGPVGFHRTIVDLTYDRSFQYGRVDERGWRMRMRPRM